MTYTRKPCAFPLFLLLLLTALFALLTLLAPGRALAAGATRVDVMGSRLTDATYYTIANDGTLQSDGNPNNYNVHFDPATSTLYLKDAKIEYAGYKAIDFDGDLTISLSGANEINASNGGDCRGIEAGSSSLTITGGGSLVVTATCTVQTGWLYIRGIYIRSGNLVIDTNTSVTCIAQAASGITPRAAYGIDVCGNVTVNGTLNASACAATRSSYGIWAAFSINVTGELEGIANNATYESIGVMAVDAITTSGTLKGTSVSTSTPGYGVAADAGLTITAGTLEGQASGNAFRVRPTISNYPTALVWFGDTQAAAMATAGKAPSQAGNYHESKYATIGEPLTAVTLSNTYIAVNETYAHAPILTPANAANAVFTWSSSNTNIFTVNNQGTQAVLTGVGVGTATLTATTLDGSITATCEITVAATLPTVRVGNVDVTRGGRWQINPNGEGRWVQTGPHNVAYDVRETTLSLNGLRLNSTFGTTAADNGAIYAADSINIRLSSTNEVRNTANFATVSGLRINGGDLTVTGAGTLSVTAANRTASASSALYGVNVDGSLTVQTGATLTAAAAQVGSELHVLTYGVVADGNIEANGILEGSACAADAYSYGVFSSTGTIAVPGKLKGTAGAGYASHGVFTANDITVTGELEGTANTANNTSAGVYAYDGAITTTASGTLKGTAGDGQNSYGVAAATTITVTGELEGIANDAYLDSIGVMAGGAITTSGTLRGTAATGAASYGVAASNSSLTITAGTLEGQASDDAFYNHPDAASYTNAIAWFGDTQSQAMGKAGVVARTTTEQYQASRYAIVGPGVATLTLNLADLTIAVNENGTLAIETIEPDGALNQVFEWQSDNPSVATVTPGSTSRIAGRAASGASATVTGVSEGTATITVQTLEGNASATAVVTVNAAPAPAPATSTPPQTGDNEPLWLWVTLAGLSLLAIGTLYTLKQRKESK